MNTDCILIRAAPSAKLLQTEATQQSEKRTLSERSPARRPLRLQTAPELRDITPSKLPGQQRGWGADFHALRAASAHAAHTGTLREASVHVTAR